MTARNILVAGLLSTCLMASACNGTPDTPTDTPRPKHVRMDKVVLEGEASKQLVAAAWNRSGDWIRLTARTRFGEVPVAAARDAHGARFVTVAKTAGYTVTRGGVDCKRNAANLQDALVSKSDDDEPDVSTKRRPAELFISSDELRRLCAAKGTRSRPVTQAVIELRSAEEDTRQAYANHAPTFSGVPKASPITSRVEAETKARAEAQRTGRPTTVVQDYPGMPKRPSQP